MCVCVCVSAHVRLFACSMLCLLLMNVITCKAMRSEPNRFIAAGHCVCVCVCVYIYSICSHSPVDWLEIELTSGFATGNYNIYIERERIKYMMQTHVQNLESSPNLCSQIFYTRERRARAMLLLPYPLYIILPTHKHTEPFSRLVEFLLFYICFFVLVVILAACTS